MEDFLPFIVFVIIGTISMLTKGKENRNGEFSSTSRVKRKPQSLNRRPINAGMAREQIINSYQQNITTMVKEEQNSVAVDDRTQDNMLDDHAVFKHDDTNIKHKHEAATHIVPKVEHEQSHAALFANFIKNEGPNAIIISEILGKPKGWE